MKKILCLILSVFMLASVLSGCGNKATENALYNPDVKIGDTGGLKMPLSETGEEITWMVTSTVDGLNDSWVTKKIREVTGVNLQLMTVNSSNFKEKYSTLVAAKDLPDISGAADYIIAQDLCVQGAFAAVEDYLDVVPNFKKTFVDNPENSWIFESYKAADGKLYGFYGYDWSRDINTGVAMYRKDVFDKHGIEMWNSPETFYQTLKKLKELYPDSTPLALKTGDKSFETIAKHWGLTAHNPSYIEETGKWVYTDITPEYKEILDFVKKLYNEGLLDPEFLTATQAAWTSKMTQADKAFVTIDWIGRMSMFKEQTKDTVPEYDLRFSNPIGPDQKYEVTNQVCWARYVSNNDKAETAFKLLDFILSPAGKELITMGIEGETYTLNSEGKAEYIEFPGKIPTINELEEKYGMFVEQMYLSFDRRSSYFQFTKEEQEAQDYMLDENHVRAFDPILTFTAEDQERCNEINSELNKAAKEFSVKYVLGNESWDDWLKKAEKLGASELIKIHNDTQAKFDAAMK